MRAGAGRLTSSAPRAVYYALASNIAVAACKFAVAFYTNSGSALAEAVHSSADCLNQLVLLVGHRAARAMPDEQHPFGFGREIYFYGMLVAMQLFIFGGVASIVIGGFRAMHHSPLERPLLAIGVLCVSGVIEALALRASVRTIERRHRARGLLTWFKESGRPSVMLSVSEDLAAVAGVFVSVIAIGITVLTGNPLYDALGSIGVGLVLMASALFSMSEIKSLLVGESAHQRIREEMHAWLSERNEVRRIVSLIALKWSEDLVIAIQAELEPHDSASELVRTINRIENDLKARFPSARWIFFEPELREHGRAPL
ncbi:cation diffusion facilitator family transporter [Paraburkholderia sprentiae WSM5005]|uniref:Cation diffusion facilitator family transporter n=2 Tax=Paraburkholderia sprentiae TaxID=948107 RepID=A0A1I9YQS1_9BURK|nr:cation diffusion facilitator family transporter [Paraburkholderia sprentiae WSM5005]